MKREILNFVIFITFLPIVMFSQTPKQIAEMQESINKDYFDRATDYLRLYNLEKEQRVQNYLDKTSENRIKILRDGSSMYMIDVLDGKPIYYSVENTVASAGTLTNKMYGFLGLDTEGTGMQIGVWDENRALGTHQEFTISNTNSTSRMTYGDNAITGTSTNHATHVAGTMVARGANTSARGMAFRANIVSYNWADDTQEVQSAASNGMLVTNHSYGVPLYNNGVFNVSDWVPGNYSSESVSWDLVAYSNPYTLSVISAGNDGNASNPYALASGGWDKLIGNKVSKNNLVVANTNNPVRNSNGDLISVAINSGSSQGPTDDLRIKPDISGIGTDVFSSIGTSTTSYASLSGTSMAAPNVSGSILLLQQYYNTLYSSYMRASTLKGIVCLTADDAGTEGPDPVFGWGLLNMKTASDLIRFRGENKSVVEENILTTGQAYIKTITLEESGVLLAGISWTDFPGSANNGVLNSASSKALVNDLDIRITKDGETYLPWALNIFSPTVAVKADNISDNVEIIKIDNAEAGVYTITITGKGSMYSPPGQTAGQAYSLIVYAKELTASASIDDFGKLSEIKVYPNPIVGSVLFIENSSNFLIEEVEIFDTVGKKMLSSKINNNSIDVSDLTSGVYFVKIYSEGSHVTKKIIKK